MHDRQLLLAGIVGLHLSTAFINLTSIVLSNFKLIQPGMYNGSYKTSWIHSKCKFLPMTLDNLHFFPRATASVVL